MLVQPNDDIQLVKLLKYCQAENIAVMTIGSGNNFIGSDMPFEGITIRLNSEFFARVVFGRHHITVGAGVNLHRFATECAEQVLVESHLWQPSPALSAGQSE